MLNYTAYYFIALNTAFERSWNRNIVAYYMADTAMTMIAEGLY